MQAFCCITYQLQHYIYFLKIYTFKNVKSHKLSTTVFISFSILHAQQQWHRREVAGQRLIVSFKEVTARCHHFLKSLVLPVHSICF